MWQLLFSSSGLGFVEDYYKHKGRREQEAWAQVTVTELRARSGQVSSRKRQWPIGCTIVILRPLVVTHRLSRGGTRRKNYNLHGYILTLWGMPLREMVDPEKLSRLCKKSNRWYFLLQIPQQLSWRRQLPCQYHSHYLMSSETYDPECDIRFRHVKSTRRINLFLPSDSP